jgi:hypothetical protein
MDGLACGAGAVVEVEESERSGDATRNGAVRFYVAHGEFSLPGTIEAIDEGDSIRRDRIVQRCEVGGTRGERGEEGGDREGGGSLGWGGRGRGRGRDCSLLEVCEGGHYPSTKG